MTAAKTRSMKYGGYHRRRNAKVDAELMSVDRGTPGGEYLRRFWHPIALASELGELPLAIRILGEDLVVFRDGGGRVGLLERRCSHRNTSLEYGLIQERGIRCCYHGWHYDVDGTILETPGEPSDSRIKNKLCHGAYPVHEYAGLVFAYMGPPDEKPEFPVYDSWLHPEGNKLVPYKLHNPFHWLQAHENGADPIHTCFLHARGSEIQFSEPFRALPELEFFETPIGVLSVATRRWNDYLWVRASDVILPNAAQFGGASIVEHEKFALGAWLTRWIVPIDDTNAYAIGLRHFNPVIDPEGEADEQNIGLGRADFPGQVAAPTHAEGQRNPGDFEAQAAQGVIAVHGNETRGVTDQGVVMTRKLLRKGIRAVSHGRPIDAPRRYAANPVPTYNLELVTRVPPVPGQHDNALVRRFGHQVAEIIINSAELPPGHRQETARARVRALIAGEFS